MFLEFQNFLAVWLRNPFFSDATQRDFSEERIADSLFDSVGMKSKKAHVVDVTGCRTTWMHTDV